MKHLRSLTAVLAFAACGDNGSFVPPDPDAAPDSPPPDDAPVDTPVGPFEKPAAFAIPLSVAGQDQLQSVAAAPGGKFYAAGFAAVTVTAPKMVVVVKYNANGTPDPTFGGNGVTTTPLEFFPTGGGADEIDITVDANGKILVSATTRSATIPLDRDVGLVRLNPNGTLDTTFNPTGAIPGVSAISLNTAIINGATVTAADAPRSVGVDAAGNIYVHAVSRGLGNKANGSGDPRTDTDYVVARIVPDGSALDTNWGGDEVTFTQGGTPVRTTTAGLPGQFRLNFVDQVVPGGGGDAVPTDRDATPRAVKPLPDGKVLLGGYGNTFFSGGRTQPVVYKLDANGDLDTSWGAEQGLFHEQVLPFQTEVYNMALHGTHFTTAGYGRANEMGETNQYISLRFKIDATSAESVRDVTWGGAANGAVVFDPSGNGTGSNCRNAIALPNGKTLMIGSTGSGHPAQNAVVSILDADGALDTSYGTGIHVYELGANGADQFWGGAVSGDNIVIVGYSGGPNPQTDIANDDAYAVVFPVHE